MGVSFLFQQINNRTRGKTLNLCQERFRSDVRENFFTKRFLKKWNKSSQGCCKVTSPDGHSNDMYVWHLGTSLRRGHLSGMG